jgi:hypothetical protein
MNDRKTKILSVFIRANGRLSPFYKQGVQDLDTKPGIIEQGAIPIPDDVLIARLHFA